VRSLSASGSANSYFSINGGVTDLVGFNQNGNGDYGDWLSPSCATPHIEEVQYAFTCAGGTADISATSTEGIALDVIGYNLVATATPEPGTLALFGTALVCVAVIRRRRGRSFAIPLPRSENEDVLDRWS
jgi:PEP-CTERM motif-containing protein